MKSYIELQAEIKAIQQQIIEAKKNAHTNTLRGVKLFFANSLPLLLR